MQSSNFSSWSSSGFCRKKFLWFSNSFTIFSWNALIAFPFLSTVMRARKSTSSSSLQRPSSWRSSSLWLETALHMPWVFFWSADSRDALFTFSIFSSLGHQLQGTATAKCDTAYEHNTRLPMEDPASTGELFVFPIKLDSNNFLRKQTGCSKSPATGDKPHWQRRFQLQLQVVWRGSSHFVEHSQRPATRQNKSGCSKEKADWRADEEPKHEKPVA